MEHDMLRLASIVAFALAMVSCGEKTEPRLLDAQADADSSNAAGNEATGESEMMFALTAADPEAANSDEELAAASAEAAKGQLSGTCVTTVTAGNVVTYTLVNCTGPFGFVTMSGELVATYSLRSGGVHAVIVGNDLSINEGSASVEATVLRTADGTAKVLDIDTNWHGETAAGEATSRIGDYVARIDESAGCVSLDGDWTTTIGEVAWNTVVDGYAICRGECPSAGGSITWEGAASSTTVEYDGDGTANWSNSRGRSGTVRLFCAR